MRRPVRYRPMIWPPLSRGLMRSPLWCSMPMSVVVVSRVTPTLWKEHWIGGLTPSGGAFALIADQRWDAALADSAFAPTDARFADRLRAIAGTCEAEAVVLHEAAANPSLRWDPVTEPGPKGLTYELARGHSASGSNPARRSS